VPAADRVIAPGTGLALPVRRGQVLRVEQVRGGQGVDVNVFALADHRERFGASRTRAMHGLSIGVGGVLWSASPRDRPLMTLVADTAGVRHDITYPACSAFEYEFASGVPGHTSCAAIQAEAIRAWRLTPDDVHDPLNLWLESGAENGELWWRATPTQPGDHVELLAHTSVLAALNPCGDDLFGSSSFEVAPVRVRLRSATAEERARWLLPERPALASQQATGRLRRRPILGERRLRPDPAYRPRFATAPLRSRPFQIELPAEARARIDGLRAQGTFGSSDGEIVRAALWRWWQEHHARGDAGGYPWK
jgi:uncharacterized protein YcgI (DUF1989 family)